MSIKLFFTNIIRRLRGKPPITNLYIEDVITSTQDMFLKIANKNIESILICVNKSENTYNTKVFLNLDDDSELLEHLPIIFDNIEMFKRGNDEA